MRSKRLSSEEIILQSIGENPHFLTATLDPEPVYKYFDNQRTDTVIAKRLTVIIEGIAVDTVKLPKSFEISSDDLKLKPIQFLNLTASEFGNNIYFKAENAKVVKHETSH